MFGRIAGNLGKTESKFEIVMLGSIYITILWNTAHFVLKNNEADSSTMLVPID
jgi:hypothetical protein